MSLVFHNFYTNMHPYIAPVYKELHRQAPTTLQTGPSMLQNIGSSYYGSYQSQRNANAHPQNKMPVYRIPQPSLSQTEYPRNIMLWG
jgi:hypothetical protein